VFIRRKKNKSGTISIQVLEKRNGKNVLLRSIGSSREEARIKLLEAEARHYIQQLSQQKQLDLGPTEDAQWVDSVRHSIQRVRLVGPELILGKLFDQIGFDQVPGELFRVLVVTRLVYPFSKLKTVRYLREHKGLELDVQQVYRFLDQLQGTHKDMIEQLSYQHTLKILQGGMSVMFYDVTTLYFEIDREDELRKTGFSKDGKHKHPQILLGLLVSVGGYPLAYELFEGNKYEGHTMLPVVDRFKKRFRLDKLVIVADSGLLTQANIDELLKDGYEFILGARIRNESRKVSQKILSLKFKDGQSRLIRKDNGLSLVIHYSASRAAKDAYNRRKGLQRLEKALSRGKLTKNHINNRGYNKYLHLDGELDIRIDYDKYEADASWDGLKGYLTNTTLSAAELIANYRELWKIERAFRVAKSDLQVRPVYHRLHRRIEAHVLVAFAAFKLYKELERQLEGTNTGLSAGRAIEIMKTIHAVELINPISGVQQQIIVAKEPQQLDLLNFFDIQLG
jgi:transposase